MASIRRRSRIEDLTATLAFHAWYPARNGCLCGADVDWGDHPAHQALALTEDFDGLDP